MIFLEGATFGINYIIQSICSYYVINRIKIILYSSSGWSNLPI